MESVLLQIFNGVSLSSILLLTALGLMITFGLMKIINMAHGEFLMIGAYTTYCVQNFFLNFLPKAAFDAYYIVALPMSFIVSAAIGLGLERLLIRRLYGRPMDSLLVTFGVSLILQQLARNLFGTANVNVTSPSWLDGTLVITDTLQLPVKRLFILGMAAAVCVGMYFLLYRSNAGRKVRAVMQNRPMAACLGIPAKTIDAATFAIGSGIAGLAGCALTLLGSIGPTLGANYIVDSFMTVVVGGVGTLLGTACGAGFMGVGNTILGALSDASMGKVLVLVAVIVFLQFRPRGMFAAATRSLEDE